MFTRFRQGALVAPFVFLGVLPAAIPPGDAQQGAALFKELGCVSCHSVSGQGAKTAPDLAVSPGRAYTPDHLAAAMWNHAPAMWGAMQKQKMDIPKVNPEQAADLFAFFFAARYFEGRGDASRGRKLYVEKGCSDCHNITSGNAAGGAPVIRWEAFADPVELARLMWNHAPQMRAAMEKQKKPFPKISSGEMNDIVVYLRSLPQTKGLQPAATFASAVTGEKLFELKGCAECHHGEQSLTRTTGFKNAADVAAAMWNHAGLMKQSSPLRPEEMTRIAGYVWSLQFGLPTGNVDSGRRMYETKGCQGCHGAKPPASLVGAEAHAYSMLSALWNHGPQMAAKIRADQKAWPKFTPDEMSNLLTWLGTVR
jgi:cytochrome c2